MPERFRPDRLRPVLDKVDALQDELVAATDARAATIAGVREEHQASAVNLVHYLVVRAHDLRPLQRQLADLSLSSLGRMEGHVYDTLHGVRLALLGLLGELSEVEVTQHSFLSGEAADRLLNEHAVQLLGPSPDTRHTRIMVTLPTEAMRDRALLRELLLAGMSVVRINLAHDGPAAWSAMVENLRAAEAECGRSCRILADLPGPKLRTGAIVPGPRVVRVRPARDELGLVTDPARIDFLDPGAIAEASAALSGGAVSVPLAEPLAPLARPGDTLVVTDTRGRKRRFSVQATGDGACHTSIDRTAYMGSDGRVELRRGKQVIARSRIGALPPQPSYIPLNAGDLLVVTRAQTPGRAAAVDAQGRDVPACVPCTLPEVFDAVRDGQRILFDDGKIAGTVEAHDADEMLVRITAVPPGGARLRSEKGINLPDTDLHSCALTAHDRGCLDWVAGHADAVGMSFVQRPADVLALHEELGRRGRPDLGIVLKIETAKGFQRLPELLFAGQRGPLLGVMVARGDLAVEVGYARLAEVQEEILWLCEAAHVPVIWATAVLDSMARTGVPSRSEVTDAAMGVRAECVMLNKGPHIVETTRFLGGVLERMQEHHAKKRSMLRRLRVAGAPRTGE